jgi:hypothetical protein
MAIETMMIESVWQASVQLFVNDGKKYEVKIDLSETPRGRT